MNSEFFSSRSPFVPTLSECPLGNANSTSIFKQKPYRLNGPSPYDLLGSTSRLNQHSIENSDREACLAAGAYTAELIAWVELV